MHPATATGRYDVDTQAVWHSLPAEEALRRLETSAKRGLTAEEARRRLERYGPNRLPQAERESVLIHFLKQFHNVLIYVLLAAAVVAALAAGWRSAVASRWHTAARSPARARAASIFARWQTTVRLNPGTG